MQKGNCANCASLHCAVWTFGLRCKDYFGLCEEHFGQRRKEHSGLRVVKNILGYLELRIVEITLDCAL